MSEELYEPPGETISQGDVFELLPNVYLDNPLLALDKQSETIFTATAEPYAKFDDKTGQAVAAICKRARGILVSHDCELDKPQVARWLICPVLPLSRLRPETQDRVKRNRVYAMLSLPKYRDIFPDSFADFNQITTLNSEFVKAARRLVSLSDVGRRAFYVQFVRWATRWELRDLKCPHCSVVFNPSQTLPVRT